MFAIEVDKDCWYGGYWFRIILLQGKCLAVLKVFRWSRNSELSMQKHYIYAKTSIGMAQARLFLERTWATQSNRDWQLGLSKIKILLHVRRGDGVKRPGWEMVFSSHTPAEGWYLDYTKNLKIKQKALIQSWNRQMKWMNFSRDEAWDTLTNTNTLSLQGNEHQNYTKVPFHPVRRDIIKNKQNWAEHIHIFRNMLLW